MNEKYNIQTENYVQRCDICGEYYVSYRRTGFYMCDKCKNAIMAMRDFIYPPKGEEK